MAQDHYFKVDFHALLDIPQDTPNIEAIIEAEIDRAFPKATVDNVISFGKYRGKTYREIYSMDPEYIAWFLRNNNSIDIDENSFAKMMNKNQ